MQRAFMMGGLVVAALGVVLIFLAYKGPGAWQAAWAVLVQQGTQKP